MFPAHNKRLFDGFSERFFPGVSPEFTNLSHDGFNSYRSPQLGGEAGRDWLRESPSLGGRAAGEGRGLNCHLLRGHWLGWGKCQGIGMKFCNGPGGLEAELGRGGR